MYFKISLSNNIQDALIDDGVVVTWHIITETYMRHSATMSHCTYIYHTKGN